ncbi:hypothetical protein [Streptomyces sp. NPDC088785]|uniref:hypothetical protein n=1 Tax=Streptomyces sp. NPDC088785 TaxID=3365897 RepID=UPI003829EDEE
MTDTSVGAAGYAARCQELYEAGAAAAVRRAASEGIERCGPDPGLWCWLGLGHLAEDEDDHDDEAERAFRAGLALDPDHPGLLSGYARLCFNTDGFDRPGRAARAAGLLRRVEELAPGSEAAEQARAAQRWAGRSWREDVVGRTAVEMTRKQAVVHQAAEVADVFDRASADGGDAAALARAGERRHPEHLGAAVLAATMDELSGPWRAPLRFLVRRRAAVWTAGFLLALATNVALRSADVASDPVPYGFLWLVPLWLADRRLAAARERGRETAFARHEARLAGPTPPAGPTPRPPEAAAKTP